MSSVILQVGQCGNQIGEVLWNMIDGVNATESGYIFSHSDGYYRSVVVDTEPKVLKRVCRRRPGSCTHAEDNIIMDRSGRGNNWAFGFYGKKSTNEENNIFYRTMHAIRKEIERCDCYCGTVLIHSLSGGTGSGVGSRLLELLRDEYPTNYILSCAVAPFVTGESPLQNYNAVLSLSYLTRLSDGVIMFSNDEILQRLQKRINSGTENTGDAPATVTLSEINHHIASCLGGLIFPVDSITPCSGISIGMETWEMVRSLCPMTTHKFIHVNSISRKKSTWEDMTKALINSLKRYNIDGLAFRSLANLIVARGDEERLFNGSIHHIENTVKHSYNTVQWNPFPIDFWTSRRNTVGSSQTKTLTIASNYSNIIPQLENVLHSARLKFHARAYLHWYEKYGCNSMDFIEAFDNVQSLVDGYREALL